MSVINQMLRDLDARGQGDGAARRAALAAVGDAGVARSHRPASSRLWWVVALLTVILAAVVVGIAMDRWRAIDAASPVSVSVSMPEPLPALPASPSTPEPGAVEPALAAPSAVSEPPVALPTPAETPAEPAAEPAAEPRLAATPAAPVSAAEPTAALPSSSAAVPAAPAATRPATPAPAQAPPAARASIERVAPSEDPLAEARTALADGRADDALAALAAQPHGSAERDALEAAALQQLGRLAESGQAYRRALAQEPDIGAWWAGLGISLDAEGRGAEALDAFREAQRRGPLDPALADYLGERVEALSAGETPR
jgi:MSHA biogenesis protein MshN